MTVNELLAEKKMTKYRLAKSSGVSQTTINDICSGKVNIRNCTGETLYRLAHALDVSMESLLLDSMQRRPAFEIFKSNVCHQGKGAAMPETSMQLLDAVFASSDYEALYRTMRESELESKELLLEFEQKYPNTLKGESIDSIINAGRRKRREGQKDSMLAKLEEKKRVVEKNKQSPC